MSRTSPVIPLALIFLAVGASGRASGLPGGPGVRVEGGGLHGLGEEVRVECTVPGPWEVLLIAPTGWTEPLVGADPGGRIEAFPGSPVSGVRRTPSGVEFEIDTSGLDPGPYRLEVRSPGGGVLASTELTLDAVEVDVDPSPYAENLTIRIRTTSAVSGREIPANLTLVVLPAGLEIAAASEGKAEFSIPPGSSAVEVRAESGPLEGAASADLPQALWLRVEGGGVHRPGEGVTIWVAWNGRGEPSLEVTDPTGTTLRVEVEAINETWWRGIFLPGTPTPLGEYRATAEAGGLEASAAFEVDVLDVRARAGCRAGVCLVNLTVSDGVNGSPVDGNATALIRGPDGRNSSVRGEVSGGSCHLNFEPWSPGEYSVSIRISSTAGVYGEVSVSLTAPSGLVWVETDRGAYSPGDTVSITVGSSGEISGAPEVTLRLPGGLERTLRPRPMGRGWACEVPLNSSVELGLYSVEVRANVSGVEEEASAEFLVDVISLNATAVDGALRISVAGVASGPLDGANVTVTVPGVGGENLSLSSETEGGEALVRLPDLPPGDYVVVASAEWMGLGAEEEVPVSIPGGAPEGGLSLQVGGELWLPAGEVEVEIGVLEDGRPANATLNFTLRGGGGPVREGSVKAEGSVRIDLGRLDPGDYELEIRAARGNLTASKVVEVHVTAGCGSEVSVGNLTVEAAGACLSPGGLSPGEGRWEGWTLVRVSLEGDPGFSANLSAPAGLAALDPRTLLPAVRAAVGPAGDTVSIAVEDGGPSDPDGSADGRVELVLAAPGPARVGTPGAAPTRGGWGEARVNEIAGLEAEGTESLWSVKVLEVEEPGVLRLGGEWVGGRLISGGREIEIGRGEVLINSSGTVFIERPSSPLPEPAPAPRVRSAGAGRLLVEVGGKSAAAWRRVEVRLPPGAECRGVLAVGNNSTRRVDEWYQAGDEVVFYDDPNQYYYVLYGVPPWWDPDGPDRGEDWHYRVPLKVPALTAWHTVLASVDFGSLLSRLNVSGTFDNNSVRVVDPSGALVPRQEYIPTGPSSGLVKFLLPKDLPSTSTFYVYFDVLENGAKSQLNTLNSGADSGTLTGWSWGESPAGIESIVEASPPGPYLVLANSSYGTPSQVADDGLPLFGGYSVVVGYRVNATEDYTSAGEDTWASYDIMVPKGGGEIHFWYRVESWDSENYDYLTVTLRNATDNSLLDTILAPYNPNPGNGYGRFNDSGWLSASYDLSAYEGELVRINFTVHTFSDDLYKTWAYVDNLTWANSTAVVEADMVEGFGVNVTAPRGVETYGPLEVRAAVDAAPESVVCRVYDPSGNLVASAPLYDDGTHGDPAANDGEFTNSDVYDIPPGAPLGVWRVVVLANDSTSSLLGPRYDGLIHIPGRPTGVNYTDFFNVGEAPFEVRANLTGVVFEDSWPLASGYGPADSPIGGARVGLFLDDGDGELDPYMDALVDVTSTSASGRYSFLAGNRTYLVAVDSRSLTSPRGLNPGRSWDETWAEQTYQVGWNGTAHSGEEKFGGADPTVSDACSLTVPFRDDFEVWSGWNNYLSGVVVRSSEQAHGGRYSLKKTLHNDPNGGYKLLGETVGWGYILQGYVYRPSGWSGGPIDRIGLENGSFDGYTFAVNHNTGKIWIDRRTDGSPTRISATVSWDPPEDSWYFWRMIFFENHTLAFQVLDQSGHVLAEVRATDSAYGEFDRVVVHGGWEYYVDDLMLWRPGSPCEHFSRVEAGKYRGESLDFGFSFDLVVNPADSDQDPSAPRTAQGTLRQFLQNANAISGADRSWFVMATPPNSGDASGAWWNIALNSTMGPLPQISDDDTSLNGTVFWPNGTVRDSNPGWMGSGWDVGVWGHHVRPFDRPEVEVDGWNSVALEVTGARCGISRLALYGGTVRGVGADNLAVQDNLVGMMANGSDPTPTGAYYGIGILGSTSGAMVRHNYVRVDNSGIRVETSSAQLASDVTIEENVVGAPTSGQTSTYDGILAIAYGGEIRNLTVRWNLVEDQVGAGMEVLGRVGGSLEENTVRHNGFSGGAPSPEDVGVVFFPNFSGGVIVRGNVIAGNAGSGLTVKSPAANVTISENSFYNNSGLGIDLDAGSADPNSDGDGDGVTENDGLLNSSAADWGVDYPVISVAGLEGDLLYVRGFLNSEGAGAGSPNFAGARVEVFLVNSSVGGDDLAGNYYPGTGELYGEGWIYLGNLTVDPAGNFSGWINLSGAAVTVEEGDLVTATASLPGNGTSEFGPDVRVGRLSLNLTVRKSIEPASPCEYNVTLNVTNWAYNPAVGILVYDEIPDGMGLTWEDPPHAGSSGGVYWWRVDLGPAGSADDSALVRYTMGSAACGSSDYELSEALEVGLDPPGGINLSAREFVEATLYPNGTAEVSRLWGLLTVSNPSPDPVYDVWVDLDPSGYSIYPDYPIPSNSTAAPPLHVPQLPPGGRVRWRYEADPSLADFPASASESTSYSAACGSPGVVRVEIRLDFSRDLRGVRLTKEIPGWLRPTSASASCGSVSIDGGVLNWTIGSVSAGQSCSATLRGRATLTASARLPAAILYYERDWASILGRVTSLRAVGPAAAGVEKNRTESGYLVRPSFENLASGLDYELDGVCVWEGGPPGGAGSRLVRCESPGAPVPPGGEWVGSWWPDPAAPDLPRYYASVNFTVTFHPSGSQIPLRGGGLVGAEVVEPDLACPRPGVRPRPPELRFTKEARPGTIGVGDRVGFRIVVENVGETRVSGVVLTDRLPPELRYVGGSGSVDGVPAEPARDGGSLTWSLPPLDPGEAADVEFEAEAVARPRGTDVVYNTVVYGGEEVARAAVRIVGGYPPGPARGPNVTAAPRLTLRKTCPAGGVALGSAVTFTISLENSGDGPSGEVVVEDRLPADLRYVAGTASPEAEYSSGTLRWRVGPLSPGEAFRASFQAVVVGGAGGEVVNSVTAGNLSADCALRVLPPPPNVSLSKAGSYLGGGAISYVVTVRSDGAADVTLVDNLPGGVRVVPGSLSVEGALVRAASASGGVVRVEARVGGGEVMVVSFRARASAGLTGDVINVAELPPYGLRASSVVTIPRSSLAAASFEGPLALPAAALLMLAIRRRRGGRLTLLDYGSLRFAALSGGGLEELTGGFRAAVSEATLSVAMGDPAVAPMVERLLVGGEVEVIGLDEGRFVEALALARGTGMGLELAAGLLAAAEVGVRGVALSDARGAALAADMGFEVILIPLLPGGGRR